MAIRKDVATLSAADRARLVAGFLAMKAADTYDTYIDRHAKAMEWKSISGAQLNAAHMGPAFLPWHRKFIWDFEKDLQAAIGDPTFGLPYYDWTDGLGTSSPIWGTDLLGGAGNPVSGNFSPLRWQTVDAQGNPTSGLVRTLGTQSRFPIGPLPTLRDVQRLMYRSVYDRQPYNDQATGPMRNALEGFDPPGMHNRVHGWVGGQMSHVPISSNDPAFFLHHCNVDRIWAQWQITYPRSPYEPVSGGPTGHNLHDPMYPWNEAADIVRPINMLSVPALGYSYDRYYGIKSFQIVVTTGASTFSPGPDGTVSIGVLADDDTGPIWSAAMDAAHCDHAPPFQVGRTDTFTYENPSPGYGPCLTPAMLYEFSLGKSPSGSWAGRGDWTVAALKIVADGLVLYDNQGLGRTLNSGHPELSDGKGNLLNRNLASEQS